jgi:fructokinase
MDALYGGIEAGGTKFVCAVGRGPEDLPSVIRLPTTNPEETLGRAIEFFREHHARQPLAAIGIGAFGPVDLNPQSPHYGFVTSTPKPGWNNTDMAGEIGRALDLPVGFDTDVNVAALGEFTWGAAQGLQNCLYLTVGTGIGGGGLVGGQPIHGLVHPEMGHIPVFHDYHADPFPGACPYHGDCLEGLAAGKAIELRWGQRAETLPADHPAWALEADYLAQALTGFICILSPERIIMGGGICEQLHLLPLVRGKVREKLNGYIQSPAILERIDQYIVPPGLGRHAGVLGAIALARRTTRLSMENKTG